MFLNAIDFFCSIINRGKTDTCMFLCDIFTDDAGHVEQTFFLCIISINETLSFLKNEHIPNSTVSDPLYFMWRGWSQI